MHNLILYSIIAILIYIITIIPASILYRKITSIKNKVLFVVTPSEDSKGLFLLIGIFISGIIGTIGFLIILIIISSLLFSTNSFDPELLFLILFALGAIHLAIIYNPANQKILITEHGIIHPEGVIKWKEIRKYEWGVHPMQHGFYSLILYGNSDIFPIYTAGLISVEPKNKEIVDTILKTYIN